MLKKFGFLFVGYFVFSMHANASIIQDVVVQDEYVGWWDSHNYTHDLNDNGFCTVNQQSGLEAEKISLSVMHIINSVIAPRGQFDQIEGVVKRVNHIGHSTPDALL